MKVADVKYYTNQLKDIPNTDSFCISVEALRDLLKTAEYANKASYILESLPIDLDDMLDDYDEDEDY